MKKFNFIFVLSCFVAGISVPFYGFGNPIGYFWVVFAFITIRSWYHKTKNKKQWNSRTTPTELLNRGLIIVILSASLCWIVVKNIQPAKMYETEDGTLTNVDPEFEKRKIEEYNLLKENGVLLGRWEPSDSCIREVKYTYGRSDVLIYEKNDSYFMVHENTGFGSNIIQEGMRRGDVVIFGIYHFFDAKSLTFESDSYIRIKQ